MAAVESGLSRTDTIDAMTIYRYRRELAHPLAAPASVQPYVLRTFRSRADVPALHALLHEAYAVRGDSLGSCDEWWQALSSDPEFDARLVFLAETPAGTLAAAGIAWNSGFVKDLAVAPAFRRQGLGTAVLAHICGVFARQGAHAMELKVEADNQAAIALYEGMGMRRVETVGA
jgi:ribosomal protein S18 acetylase RimI-like enzyme